MNIKILAMGDSWFHYPIELDRDGNPLGIFNKVLKWFGIRNKGVGNIIHYLQAYGVNINCTENTLDQMLDGAREPVHSQDDVLGNCGEEIIRLVYGYKRSDPSKVDTVKWIDILDSRVKKYSADHDVFIILLSGGGNDITGEYLPGFVLTSAAGENIIDVAKLNAVIQQLQAAYKTIFDRICSGNPSKKFHFVMHGYDFPPVKGRAVFPGLEKNKRLGNLLPGPWLQPAFINSNNNYSRPVSEKAMQFFINDFNTMLSQLDHDAGNFHKHFVDLRGVTADDKRDQQWCNELHFDRIAFMNAADRFNNEIKTIFREYV